MIKRRDEEIFGYTVFSSIISDMNKWRLKVIRLFEIYLG